MKRNYNIEYTNRERAHIALSSPTAAATSKVSASERAGKGILKGNVEDKLSRATGVVLGERERASARSNWNLQFAFAFTMTARVCLFLLLRLCCLRLQPAFSFISAVSLAFRLLLRFAFAAAAKQALRLLAASKKKK